MAVSSAHIKRKLARYWPLLLVLAAFITAKWPHLYYPFYWDESWSYAPGIRLMYDHGPSLMPNAIDVFYSRGHPLLFYAASSAWMYLMGGYSHFNAHLYALAVSVAILIAAYMIMLRQCGRLPAVTAVMALAVNTGFFVHASYVLPEMMVALFSLLAVSAFAARKFIAAAIALALLVFTKESSAVAVLALGIAAVVALFGRQTAAKEKLYGLISVVVPVLLIGGFYLLQKHLLGWYLYPEHTGLLSFKWDDFFSKFHDAASHLVGLEGPHWLIEAVVILTFAAAIRTRRVMLLIPVLPIAVLYLTARNWLNIIPERARFILFTILVLATIIFYLRDKRLSPISQRLIVLLMAFSYTYLCFSCINFYTPRYLFAMLVPFTMGMVALLTHALHLLHPKAVWAAFPVVVAAGCFMFDEDRNFGELNLQSFHAMAIQDSTVRFLERQQMWDKKIAASNFQDEEHLTKPLTGFLHTPRVFTKVSYDIDRSTAMAVFNNIEPGKYYDAVKADTTFHLIYSAHNGAAWVEIYGR